MSRLRKIYFAKLIFRIFVLCYVFYLYFLNYSGFEIVIGWNMFNKFSVLHILFAVWIYDMLCQLIPNSKNIALGSQKLFLNRFRDATKLKDELKEVIKGEIEGVSRINYENLRDYVINTTKKAYRVFILWFILMVVLGVLYFTDKISYKEIFLLSVLFYVGDLVCVLIWCPFRLIVGSKCCTTCRIFNWDHAMMFLPFAYIPGIYTTTLLLMAILIWLIWEIHMMIHPERFWEVTNVSLRCSECTDKLCTQYCRKLRK